MVALRCFRRPSPSATAKRGVAMEFDAGLIEKLALFVIGGALVALIIRASARWLMRSLAGLISESMVGIIGGKRSLAICHVVRPGIATPPRAVANDAGVLVAVRWRESARRRRNAGQCFCDRIFSVVPRLARVRCDKWPRAVPTLGAALI
jgi:hypothetical protein